MIVENLSGLIRLVAEGSNKITDKNRTFYTDFIYLSKNDKVENYEEVSYEVWGLFLDDEIPKTKVQEMEQRIKTLQEDRDNLECVLLNTDYRLTCMELKDEGILE